jgi:hypothetical protein
MVQTCEGDRDIMKEPILKMGTDKMNFPVVTLIVAEKVLREWMCREHQDK